MIFRLFNYFCNSLKYLIFLFLFLYISLVFPADNIQIDLNHSVTKLISKEDNFLIKYDHENITSDYLRKKITEEIIIINAAPYFSSISTFSPIQFLSSLYVTDAADYLKNIPGFATIRRGGTNADPVFRGMSGSRIRILMDNGEMLGACCSRMDPPSAYIYPETFDILNLIKGPQTVLLGPVSSGGILQFERYHPRFNISKIELHSNILVGSNNKVDKNIDSIIGNKNGYIRIMSNVSHSDDYRDGNRRKVRSAWYKWNSDAIISLNVSPYTSYEISLGQGNGSAHYATKGMMDGLCLARENYGMKIETIDVSDTLDKVGLFFWYNYVNHVMGNSTPIFNNIIKKFYKHCGECTNSNIDRRIWGARGIVINQWENIECHSGIDMQTNQHRKIQHDNTWCTDFVTKDFGIFSELILNTFTNRKFIGGVRLENFNFFSNFRSDFIRKQYRMIYPAGFLRYEYNFDSLLLYYIGIGTSKRFPDYWELYDITCNKNINVQFSTLNQLLKPEQTIQIDAGLHFQCSPQINGWISSYFGYVKNFILSNYSNLDKITNSIDYINNMDAKICGTEAELNYQFNDDWCVKSNIMWAYGLNLDNKYSLPNVPPLEGTLMCKWKYGCSNVSVFWRIVTSSQFDSVDTNVICNNQIQSKNHNIIKVPGFGVLSINLTWVGSKYHKFSIGINNLFNHNYKEYLNLFNCKKLKRNNIIPVCEPGRVWWIKIEIIL